MVLEQRETALEGNTHFSVTFYSDFIRDYGFMVIYGNSYRLLPN